MPKYSNQVVLISSIFKSSLATHHHHHVFIPLHSLWPNLYPAQSLGIDFESTWIHLLALCGTMALQTLQSMPIPTFPPSPPHVSPPQFTPPHSNVPPPLPMPSAIPQSHVPQHFELLVHQISYDGECR